jgi:recombination associated protein RdgC
MNIIPTIVSKNTVSVRFYALPKEHGIKLENLIPKVIGNIADLQRDPLTGFCAPQHLLARDLNEEACQFGEFFFASLAKYQRRVNKTLLASRVHEAQEREEKARGVEHLPRAVAKDIEKQIEEALAGSAQPALSGVHLCVGKSRNVLMSTSVGNKDHDWMVESVMGATSRAGAAKTIPVGFYPDILMRVLCGVSAIDLPNVPIFEPAAETDIGAEFLTWLWWRFENRGGAVETETGLHFGYCVNGPLHFAGTPGKGKGSEKVSCADGDPTRALEAFDALMGGKLLTGCRFGLGIGEDVFSASISSDFGFRSLKVPHPKEFDGPADFVFQRTRAMFAFWDAWCALFKEFVVGRCTGPEWGATVNEIKSWVSVRRASLKG